MVTKKDYPFPTPIEIIRFLTGVLDLNHPEQKKLLDEHAFNRSVDPRLVNELLSNALYQPMTKVAGADLSELVALESSAFFRRYNNLVGGLSADGFSRKQMLPLLLEHYLLHPVTRLFNAVHSQWGGPSPASLFTEGTSALSLVISWIEKNEAGWTEFLSTLAKESRDRIAAWKRETGDLPSARSIRDLDMDSTPETAIDWPKVKTWLLLARAVEAAKRFLSSPDVIHTMRLSFWGAEGHPLEQVITEAQQQLNHRAYAQQWSDISNLQHLLLRSRAKSSEEQVITKNSLERLREARSGDPVSLSMKYWIDWFQARWCVFSGKTEDALAHYKSAFADCLYRSGEHQKNIIDEALIVASIQSYPDKVFLKNLKWAALTFGYDIPSVEVSKRSNKFSDTVEDWEINLWKTSFQQYFPSSAHFPEAAFFDANAQRGPLVVTDEKQYAPDFKNPNKKLWIGETWQKRYPQLVWFAEIGNFSAVARLLEQGARVEQATKSNETPLLVALEALCYENIVNLKQEIWVGDDPIISLKGHSISSVSDKKAICDLLICHGGSKSIINKRTQKRKLLPLISAVKTGRAVYVQNLLEMGANVNARGLDNQTPLNICLKCIGALLRPEKFIQTQIAHPETDSLFDSIRRHNMGLTGHTLDDQKRAFKKSQSDNGQRQTREDLIHKYAEILRHALSFDELREIAVLLLESGADPNAEHSSPLNGYTPLMLAAEMNERKLFEFMLIKGGDPLKSYWVPDLGENVNCWKIAKEFGSDEVLRVLADIEPALDARSNRPID